MGKESDDGIVEVEPKPNKGVISSALDLIEKAVVYLFHNSNVKNQFLSGNFAPVREETPPCSDLPVKGFLPDCLNGEFVKVGPNPKYEPVAGYHWFDGDGMIHGLRIKNGKSTYVSRYVRTSRLKQEEYFGGPKFMKLGDLKGLLGLFMVSMQSLRAKLKVLDLSYGFGTGNTALIYHHGKLLALNEGDKPYALKVLEDGDLQTLGILDYDKRLNHPFSAHPKIDPVTDEVFTFGYSFFAPPYVTYRVITKDGAMLDPVPITIPEPVMMHDFAITENYAVFMDLPMSIRRKNLMEGNFLISFDEKKKSRFGVLPRYARDELQIRWFELPSCHIFHVANAWEEDNEVVLISCRYPNLQVDALGEVKNETFKLTSELYEMRFNIESGTSIQRPLSVPTLEFPRINERYVGRKQQYVYAAIFERSQIIGVAKFDLLVEPTMGNENLEVGGNVKGIFKLGPGRYGSEAVYVPRRQGDNCDEDDGYLIFFVYDENAGKSEVNIIDAKTMSSDPVAVVELPARVPHGFHSLFVAEEQLKKQK